MRYTIDINFLDDATFKPEDHPHAGKGAHGGQFIKKNMPHASVSHQKFPVNQKMHKIASSEGNSIDLASKIKELAATQKAPSHASYANKLLVALEQHHGLAKGALGYAYSKGSNALPTSTHSTVASKPKAVETTPKKAEEFDLPKPDYSAEMQVALHQYLTTGSGSDKSILDNLKVVKNYFDPDSFASKGLSEKDKDYAKSLYKAMGGKDEVTNAPVVSSSGVPAPTTSTTPKTSDIPLPDIQSVWQKNIYAAATNSFTTLTEKATQISGIVAGVVSGGFAEAYGKKVLTKLGIDIDINGVAHRFQPFLEAEAKKPNSNKWTSQRSVDLKVLAELGKTYDHFDESDFSKLEAAVPTASEAGFKKLTAPQRNAIKEYAGATYHGVNEALRDPVNLDENMLSFVKEMDSAYEHPGSKITKDIIIRRGTNKIANTKKISDEIIAGIVACLKHGLHATFIQRGYISTSAKTPFSGEIQMKILARKGTPAIYANRHEYEVLLKHGQAFDVLDYELKGSTHHLTLVTR